jgi:hypothetical protein
MPAKQFYLDDKMYVMFESLSDEEKEDVKQTLKERIVFLTNRKKN